MTVPLAQATEIVAPYYNLALVLIVVFLFIKLFSMKNRNVFLMPWHLLFIAILIYIIEQVLTVLYFANIFRIPRIMNAVFEFIIITLFIYMLLIQKQYLNNNKVKKNVK